MNRSRWTSKTRRTVGFLLDEPSLRIDELAMEAFNRAISEMTQQPAMLLMGAQRTLHTETADAIRGVAGRLIEDAIGLDAVVVITVFGGHSMAIDMAGVEKEYVTGLLRSAADCLESREGREITDQAKRRSVQ